MDIDTLRIEDLPPGMGKLRARTPAGSPLELDPFETAADQAENVTLD